MIVNRYDMARLEKCYPGASFKPIEKDFEKGKLYFSGYWHESFKVIDIEYNVPVWQKLYIVQWEKGNVSSHSTSPDRKLDFEIVLN